MMNVTEQIKNVDLVALAESNGVELQRRGTAFVGLCPLHTEKTPSFYIYRRNHWQCFAGCGGGDAADLVQRIYSCDFPEALRRLGVSGEPLTLEEKIKIRQRKRIKAQRIQRERDLIFTLGLLIRTTRRVVVTFTPESFERSGQIYDMLPFWEYAHDLLARGTREEKDEVLEGLKDMATLRRKYLFRPDFNYRKWLFNINHNDAKGVSNHNKGAGENGKKRIRRN